MELLSRVCWTVVLVTVLWGCDNPKSVLNVASREPASRVPAGESVLPFTAASGQTMAPRELFEAFRRIEEPGVTAHLIELGGKPSMLVLEIDLALFEPALVGVGKSTLEGLSAYDAIARFDLRLVVGSGFVSELNALTPVGLLHIDGAVLSELQRYGYTRILGVRSEGIGVVASREYHSGMFESALQVGISRNSDPPRGSVRRRGSATTAKRPWAGPSGRWLQRWERAPAAASIWPRSAATSVAARVA